MQFLWSTVKKLSNNFKSTEINNPNLYWTLRMNFLGKTTVCPSCIVNYPLVGIFFEDLLSTTVRHSLLLEVNLANGAKFFLLWSGREYSLLCFFRFQAKWQISPAKWKGSKAKPSPSCMANWRQAKRRLNSRAKLNKAKRSIRKRSKRSEAKEIKQKAKQKQEWIKLEKWNWIVF
jgi:hypothetical protein